METNGKPKFNSHCEYPWEEAQRVRRRYARLRLRYLLIGFGLMFIGWAAVTVRMFCGY